MEKIILHMDSQCLCGLQRGTGENDEEFIAAPAASVASAGGVLLHDVRQGADDGIADGMASELVRALLQHLGETASIQAVPWSRGYHIVQNTPGTALFATIRNAEREPHFKWVGPIMLAQDAYYGLKGSGPKIDQPAQLHEVGPIAVPRNWFTYQELSAAGMPNLLGVTEPEQMFRMLRHGRVKLIVADNLSFYSTGEPRSRSTTSRPVTLK